MNESQLKMSKVLSDIINNVPYELYNYRGVLKTIYKQIDKYIAMFDDVVEKIYVAQWAGNYELVQKLKLFLSLNDYEYNKYLKLKANNDDLDETINFKILDQKYSFLDKMLDMITTDIDIQYQIVSMSDARLKVFRKMYERLLTLTDYYNPYIDAILQRISYVSLDSHWKNGFHWYDDLLKEIDDLVNNSYELSDKEIDTLLYLCTSTVKYTVPNFNLFQHFGEKDTLDSKRFEQELVDAKENKDINFLKTAILVQAYGMGLFDARSICEKFNIEGIEVTNDNKDTLEMYMAIYKIVNETDFNVLMEVYDEFVSTLKPDKDFRRIIVFENDLRKAFAHDLNRQVFRTDNKVYEEVNGVKVYDAGVDFKMIVTAIGAYQSEYTNQSNYSEYWNKAKIRSHGNCCSLIGNNNLSMATPKNIILGFSSMDDNMLLLSGSSDINSTPDSLKFNMTGKRDQNYMNADAMLNNTRGDYNELVYERRDLSSNPTFYKKNPDYIVFIKEYEDINVLFDKFKEKPTNIDYLNKQKKDQEEKWQESLRAAADFNVPIVVICREKVAKSELAKIDAMVREFERTKNPNLLGEIINQFENNRVGNSGMHAPICEMFFSSSIMSNYLERIKNTINEEIDLKNRNILYFALYKAIIDEQMRVVACEYGKRNKNQTSSINFNKELEELEQILQDELSSGRKF